MSKQSALEASLKMCRDPIVRSLIISLIGSLGIGLISPLFYVRAAIAAAIIWALCATGNPKAVKFVNNFRIVLLIIVGALLILYVLLIILSFILSILGFTAFSIFEFRRNRTLEGDQLEGEEMRSDEGDEGVLKRALEIAMNLPPIPFFKSLLV